MPVTFQDVVAALKALKLEVAESTEYPGIGSVEFDTLSFVDTEGNRDAIILFCVNPDGQSIEFVASECYALASCRYKAATFLALLQANAEAHHASFEVDAEAGEVALRSSVVVGEGLLHPSQLQVALADMLRTLDRFHPVIVHAMQAGVVDVSRCWQPPASKPVEGSNVDPALLAELGTLIDRSGGREGFDRLVEAYVAAGRSS